MAHFDPCDLSHHLIRDGINDVDVDPGAVGLDNPDLVRRGPQGQHAQNDPSQNTDQILVCSSSSTPPPTLLRRLSKHPCFQDLPLQVVLRVEVLASAVKEIATGLFG